MQSMATRNHEVERDEMAGLLPVPPELQHLIEKREEAERRQGPRRGKESGQDGSATQPPPLDAQTPAADAASDSEQSRQDRRQARDRRSQSRRDNDRDS